nr:helix-turn-helix transcriptional regulator [Halomonas sp. N3-2A]
MTDRAIDQLRLEEIAAHVNLSSYHFQRLFCRWVGATSQSLALGDEVARVRLVSVPLKREICR